MAFIERALTLDTDDCVLFPYGRNASGYARLRVGEKHAYGHVIVCQRAHGTRPTPEHQAAHSCGNGHLGCINPKHLSWKTPEGNASDAVAHGTVARGPKLTLEGIKSIRAIAEVMRYRDIARMFSVGGDAISNAVRGKTWKHAPDHRTGAKRLTRCRQRRNGSPSASQRRGGIVKSQSQAVTPRHDHDFKAGDLIAWRNSLDLSQNRAAKALGVARQSLIEYEAGRRPIPKYIWLACQLLAHRAGIALRSI
ncbi:helix-turn-helix transcriptional regulator [Mesorhizobium sp. DCY119]|uniref:helix-turn-helix transcriptional regulator n=1 Tax=Mesorhizobium sp. DCY119 TaxID=2108445 RepID=UPI000E6CEDD4|nr:helix-turn-helix transcriptional regulator [Mesorhizobium sp. DCY119]RJG43730.1 XRE family transcriptional regulator [Mesorhizobium sp. DCY119]